MTLQDDGLLFDKIIEIAAVKRYDLCLKRMLKHM